MKTHKALTRLFLLAMSVLIFNGCGDNNNLAHVYPVDLVEKTLVVMGDLQVPYANITSSRSSNRYFKNMSSSTTNIPQLHQNVADIAALPHKPDYNFILGDLVAAEPTPPDSGTTLQRQLDAWIGVFQGFPEGGAFNLVPLPGNHEMNKLVKPVLSNQQTWYETPSLFSYSVWSAWTKNNYLFPFAANGPTPANDLLDMLVQDESQFTFSFNWGAVHIVIINTDTLSTVLDASTTPPAPYAGWIPIHWIAADLAAAQNNPNINTILVMGHRPIEPPAFDTSKEEPTILNAAYPYNLASQLEALLQMTPKVKAYFCSHVHAFTAFKLTAAPRVWQVVAGNGGAEPYQQWTPTGGPFFGFAEVRLHQSGRLTVAAYGRAIPSPYFGSNPVAPAVLKEVISLE
jgi:hypothetical protein